MASVLIPAEQVEVLGEYDVVVCGGGPAGIAAAVSAARHGARTVLIERWPFVGGMATAAFVNGSLRSDLEKVVINGLAEELAQRMEAGGWAHRHFSYPRAYETHWFNPEGLRVVAHRLLAEARVAVLCYTVVGDPVVEGGVIQGVLIETKRGRRAVLGKIVIDGTGDGDVAAKAGLPFEMGRGEDGLVQGMTLFFRLWKHNRETLQAMPAEQIQEIKTEMRRLYEAGELPPYNSGFEAPWLMRYCNMVAVAAKNPLDEQELTEATVLATERLLKFVEYFRQRIPGCENAELDKQGFSLGIRETRRIKGLKTLDVDMVVGAKKQPDAIGHGMWMIDIHDPKGTGHTTWSNAGTRHKLPAGQSYHIPLGMCLNSQIKNLAVVGRCASSTHAGHSSVRVQSHGMVMGQGVGTCAALALEQGVGLAEVPIKKLQDTLKRDGVYLEDVPSQ